MKRFFSLAMFFCFVVLAALVVMPSAAFAEAAAVGTDYGGVLADFLSVVIFPVLGAVLLGLTGVVLNKVRQKFNIQIGQEQEAFIDSMVQKGIAYAEEKAALAIKGGVTKYTGKQKADDAIAFVLMQAPKLPMAAVEAKIMAWLGLTPGVGATGEYAVGFAGVEDE